MLVGSAPNWEGILPTMLHRHDGVWFLSRSFVVRAPTARPAFRHSCRRMNVLLFVRWLLQCKACLQLWLPMTGLEEARASPPFQLPHRHHCPHLLSSQVGVLIVALVLPMLISRDLTVVARYSRLSVFMMLILTGTIAGLVGIAVVQVGGGADPTCAWAAGNAPGAPLLCRKIVLWGTRAPPAAF